MPPASLHNQISCFFFLFLFFFKGFETFPNADAVTVVV